MYTCRCACRLLPGAERCISFFESLHSLTHEDIDLIIHLEFDPANVSSIFCSRVLVFWMHIHGQETLAVEGIVHLLGVRIMEECIA